MLYPVTVAQATDVNESFRMLQLDIKTTEIGAPFLPGQRVNLHLDGLEVSRGHSIISTPATASQAQNPAPGYQPYVEIIIQNAPTIQMPRLWGEASSLVGMELNISFDGRFVWPPSGARTTPINRVVFLAGSLGVTPLVSMLSHISQTNRMPQEVYFFYASGVKGHYDVPHVLGLERLISIGEAYQGKFYLYLYFSGHPSRTLMEAAVPRQRFEPRVILDTDILDVFKNFESKDTTVCYVAGPSDMTGHFVELFRERVGMDAHQVFWEEHGSDIPKLFHASIPV